MPRTLVPMPSGVILHPRLIAEFGEWWMLVRANMRVRGVWYRPLRSLRRAVFAANHGRKHSGERYRQCYRWKWLEAVDA